LNGKYNSTSPLPENSARAATYNKLLPQLEELTAAMKTVGESHNASVAQIAIAWAIAKKTLPIIGVTKLSQVADAISAAKISLSEQEVGKLDKLAKKTGIDTKGGWENPMT